MDEIAHDADAVKQDLHLGWAPLSRRIGIPTKRLRRWSARASLNQPQVKRPGPRKQEMVPPTLAQEIRDLRHGAKRSRGVGELQRRHETVISRRDLDALVHRARREHHRRLRESWRRVQWLTPQVAWGFDGADSARDHRGAKLVLHPMSDLASRHRFDPLVSFKANGYEIAAWVDHHCEKRGAPLFMKRDNGSPLNHHAVNEVFERRCIIPLNSPPHYPRYNGMVENSVRELKDDAGLRQAPPEGWAIAPCLQRVRAAVRTRNHIPRRCLGRRTAHDVYTSGRREWTIEERRAILDWLRIRQCEIIQSIKDAGPRAQAKAWRQAVEEWLVSNGHIRIHKPTKQNQIVSPYFHDSMGHN
jgi:hypothetical protein